MEELAGKAVEAAEAKREKPKDSRKGRAMRELLLFKKARRVVFILRKLDLKVIWFGRLLIV